MYTIHEGEILFKEKFGTEDNKRLYIKPPDQSNIVFVEENESNSIFHFFYGLFLPQGYPDSVSKDYLNYQIWDTAQAFCSTVTGILATQEVLRGVGVGDTNATPLAATVTWVIKDGCGHLGRIMFAYSQGSTLDAYSKKWRLYADTLNDAAMCMEIALPLLKNFTTLVLCTSTIMKAIVGVAGGATRAAMTQHHAIRSNMADVVAKDSAQETAVNLIASMFALLLISTVGNSLIIFALIMIHHIFFNYMAVRSVCLRTLNEPRFMQVIDAYLREEVIATPCQINKTEPIVFYQLGQNLLDLKLCGFKIIMGHSMKTFMSKKHDKLFYLKSIKETYEEHQYILFPDLNSKKMYVVIKDTATVNDIQCAYFHAVLLAIIICVINDHPLAVYKAPKSQSRPFAQVCWTIHEAEWTRDDADGSKWQCPSTELLHYLNQLVAREWPHLMKGMLLIGWDLSKHLLLVDEWRVCSAKIVTKTISDEDIAAETTPNLSSRIVTFDDVECQTKNEDTFKRNSFTIEPEYSDWESSRQVRDRIINS